MFTVVHELAHVWLGTDTLIGAHRYHFASDIEGLSFHLSEKDGSFSDK